MNATAHRARKRFGQNFLHDKAVLRRIGSAINPGANELLVEIGPGLGALTELLVASGARVIAVELDRDLAALLRQRDFGPGFTLIEGDALKTDFGSLIPCGETARVVGNLPYNISTPLLFHLLNFGERLQDMHFLLQREVVQRLASMPNSKDYGRLSVMTQYLCEVEPLFEVAPGAFVPAPRVTSQLVRLQPRTISPDERVDAQLLQDLLRSAFGQRRKTLRKALQKHFDAAELATLDIEPSRRPDTLSVAEFLRLARARQARAQ